MILALARSVLHRRLRPRDNIHQIGIDPLGEQRGSVFFEFFAQSAFLVFFLFALLLGAFAVAFGLGRFVWLGDGNLGWVSEQGWWGKKMTARL